MVASGSGQTTSTEVALLVVLASRMLTVTKSSCLPLVSVLVRNSIVMVFTVPFGRLRFARSSMSRTQRISLDLEKSPYTTVITTSTATLALTA